MFDKRINFNETMLFTGNKYTIKLIRNTQWVKLLTHPLSIPLTPIFSPRSPMMTPGYARNVSGLRIGVTKAWSPWFEPSGIISWAITMACVAPWAIWINSWYYHEIRNSLRLPTNLKQQNFDSHLSETRSFKQFQK